MRSWRRQPLVASVVADCGGTEEVDKITEPEAGAKCRQAPNRLQRAVVTVTRVEATAMVGPAVNHLRAGAAPPKASGATATRAEATAKVGQALPIPPATMAEATTEAATSCRKEPHIHSRVQTSTRVEATVLCGKAPHTLSKAAKSISSDCNKGRSCCRVCGKVLYIP